MTLHLDLAYGRSSLPLEFDAERFDVLAPPSTGRLLSDVDIGQRLDLPLGTPPLEDIVRSGASVLLVVPDATRDAAVGQVAHLVVRRLIAAGVAPYDIRAIFATGIHRRVTPAERDEILTPFLTQRLKVLDHDPRDLAALVRVGTTSGGIEVELNRAVVEHDVVILIGGVTFHYFAGFTGGRKLICPGLASSRTVAATHALAFDCERLDRRDGVGTGVLAGNAVHEAFVEAAALAPPAFCISTLVDDRGAAVDLYCGDWLSSHAAACEEYARLHTVRIHRRRPLVVAGCGGHPYDINVIQAHKTLEAASHACEEGGTIILIAECPDGPGRRDFMAWFDAANSRSLAERLCSSYKVNGQTAWSLLTLAERFDLKMVTSLDTDTTQRMRMDKVDVGALAQLLSDAPSGYVIPKGAGLRFATSGG